MTILHIIIQYIYLMLIKGDKYSCIPLILALHKFGTGKGPVVLVNAIKAYEKVEVQL